MWMINASIINQDEVSRSGSEKVNQKAMAQRKAAM